MFLTILLHFCLFFLHFHNFLHLVFIFTCILYPFVYSFYYIKYIFAFYMCKKCLTSIKHHNINALFLYGNITQLMLWSSHINDFVIFIDSFHITGKRSNFMKKTNCTSPATEGLKSFEALRRETKENGISDSPWKKSTRRSTLYAMAKIRLRTHLICRKNLYSRSINSKPFSLPNPVITKKHIFSRCCQCC